RPRLQSVPSRMRSELCHSLCSRPSPFMVVERPGDDKRASRCGKDFPASEQGNCHPNCESGKNRQKTTNAATHHESERYVERGRYAKRLVCHLAAERARFSGAS